MIFKIYNCFLSFLFIISLSNLFGGIDYQVENQPHVLNHIMKFEQIGTLKQNKNGYVYLEVASDYIAHALMMMDVEGEITPPPQYTSKRGIGAHVSVIYADELKGTDKKIHEIGKTFTFEILQLRTVKFGKERLWLIAVESPELEQLRLKYGFKSLLKGHDFHITIGYEDLSEEFKQAA